MSEIPPIEPDEMGDNGYEPVNLEPVDLKDSALGFDPREVQEGFGDTRMYQDADGNYIIRDEPSGSVSLDKKPENGS